MASCVVQRLKKGAGMFLENMKGGLATFIAVMAGLYLLIGKLAGFWFEEIIIIVIWWTVIAVVGTFFGKRFEQARPLILGIALFLAWLCVDLGPMRRLDASIAEYSDPSFRLSVLVVLVGAGYGIGHYRANR